MNSESPFPGRIEELSFDPAAADEAWSEVVRRRNARTRRGGLAAGTALVALVLAAVLPPAMDSAPDSPVRVASRGRDSALRPAPDQGKPDEGEIHMDSGPSGPGPGRPGVRTAVEEGSPPEPRKERLSPPADSARKAPVKRTRTEGQNLFVGCVSRFCVSARVQSPAAHHELQMNLCVPVSGRAWRFTYDTSQEADFRIAPEGEEPIWTWSAGQRFAASEHYLDIAPGECVDWTTAWETVDERGQRVDSGRYVLTVKTLAKQASDTEAESSVSFAVS